MKIIFSLLALSSLIFAESIRGHQYDDMIKAANTKVELEKTYYTPKVTTPKVEPVEEKVEPVEEKAEAVVEEVAKEEAPADTNASH